MMDMIAEVYAMIIKTWKDKSPQIAPSARLAENVTVIGEVTLCENSNLWYGAVVRADVSPITIGENSNVQDNSVLHATYNAPLVLGKNVTVGHAAVLHSCIVEDGALIGMGATVLDRAVIGAGSLVGAGALVPPDKVIPPGSLVVGVPAKVIRPLTEEEIAKNRNNAEHYVQWSREQLDTLE